LAICKKYKSQTNPLLTPPLLAISLILKLQSNRNTPTASIPNEFPRIMNQKRVKLFCIDPNQKNSSRAKKTSLKLDKTLSIISATQTMNK